jgi:serine/threonine protein kinase
MEYAPKGDLYTLLKAQPHQRFSEPMAAFFINQVLQAMINIHSHGFIHRDLKPENLFISLNKIKIGDFGLAINNP